MSSSSPIPTITNSRRTSRFRLMYIDTPDVDCDHLHGSSSKFKSCDNKIPAPTQCSCFRPNFHLKDIDNKNSGFLVCSVAPRSLSQWSDMQVHGLNLGYNGPAWIGRRHCNLLLSFFRHFSSRGLWCIYAPPRPKKELILNHRLAWFAPWSFKSFWFWICQ